MIWQSYQDEENILYADSPVQVESYFPYAPPTPSFKIDGLTTMTQTAISEGLERFSKQTLGLSLIGLGAGIFVGTRGAGYKPAAIIMNTGLQVVGEAYE